MDRNNGKLVRRVGWFLVGLYILLTGVGLALQFVTGSHPNHQGPPSFRSLISAVSDLVWALMGAVLISRQPKNLIGWAFSANAILSGLDDFTFGYAYYGFIAHPGSLPGVEAALLWWHWTGRNLGLVGFTILLSLFPNGRPLSVGWRKLIWISAGATVVFLFFGAIAPQNLVNFINPFPPNLFGINEGALAVLERVTWGAYSIMLLCAFASILSLILRFIRSRGVERQQLKWFAFSAFLFIPTILLLLLGSSLETTWAPTVAAIGALLSVIVVTGLPVTATLAILRYRLWDIDIIIRRTLIYGLLSTSLALVYLLSVVLLQQVLLAMTEQQRLGNWTIVASTLLTVALIIPLRRRSQDIIDRRFYRHKYDSEEILAHFSVVARDKIDLDELTDELLNTIQVTLQPEKLTMWLK